ncbi:MAG: selenium-dependent molybdenum cofactor biosynthesis protein YqeB [Anaerolineales bacterium]|jgi:xanthine dehydrogenase accessory factor
MKPAQPLILIRGGGDLATGAAVRLHRSGFLPVVTEIEQPLAIRRAVAFAEAIYTGQIMVEGVQARRVVSLEDVALVLAQGQVPVLVDPRAEIRGPLHFAAQIDARMRKQPPTGPFDPTLFTIGLGPGFTAGVDCHAVIETNRGHAMGRVIWRGEAEADTGVPEAVAGYDLERVLRAPADGRLSDGLPIGSKVEAGQVLARIGEQDLPAPFAGVLRGLLHDGLEVCSGDKIGDLDPRGEPSYAFHISDKALAVGGGVMEALLSQPEIRALLGGSNAAER